MRERFEKRAGSSVMQSVEDPEMVLIDTGPPDDVRLAGLELKPDNWNEYYFDNGKTLFEVAEYLDKLCKAERAAKR